MLYRVYLVFRMGADGSTVAVRNVLRTLTGTTLESFEPMQEKLVGQVDLPEPLELDEERVRNLLKTQAPNASGLRLEPVAWGPVMDEGLLRLTVVNSISEHLLNEERRASYRRGGSAHVDSGEAVAVSTLQEEVPPV